jgi:hypothetical protein
MFDCIVLIRMMRAFFPDEKLVGVTDQSFSWGLLVAIPLLAVEQLIASVLIAPKRPPSNTATLGLQLYLLGIGIQEVIVVYTSVLAVILHRKLTAREAPNPQAITNDPSDSASTKWRSISYALLFSLGAILARIAYRLIELSGLFLGYMQFLAHNEVFFYTLECLPVLAAVGVWAIVDTELLLDQQYSDRTPVGAYRYYEVSGELADNVPIPLSRVSIEDVTDLK